MKVYTEQDRQFVGRMAREFMPGDMKERREADDYARKVIDGMRTGLEEDDPIILASFAFHFANLIAGFSSLTVGAMSETLERTVTAYALGAAHLLGQYDYAANGDSHAKSNVMQDGYL